jgi:hypothetical protein
MTNRDTAVFTAQKRQRAGLKKLASTFSNLYQATCPLKEVIQPLLPEGLPCYDFIPVIGLTLDASLLAVGPAASGKTNSHDVTGGVYKTLERIHGDIADSPLLAIPSSCSRVADYNLNWGRLSGICYISRLRCLLYRPL